MWRRDGNNYRALAQRQLPNTVQQSDVAKVWPTDSHLLDDGVKPGLDLFFICLVFEHRDTRPALGMVANRSREENDSATVSSNGPVVERADGQLVVSQGDPCIGGSCRHDWTW